MLHCPACGSHETYSRRQLFHNLMANVCSGTSFSWYNASTPGACPPKSSFVILLGLVGVVVLPLGLYLLAPEFSWLNLSVLIVLTLLTGLLVDILLTSKRYQQWNKQRVCGNCIVVFSDIDPATVEDISVMN